MSLEKSTYVTTQSNGRFNFRKIEDDLEIQCVDADGTVRDSGTLSESDLRSLLKDNFSGKQRAPRKAKAAPNGKVKRAEATPQA